MNLIWIIGPAVGSVIGYVTNDIAIRMLFRPRASVFLFGKKLPFTPGLIPKERERIAKSVGGTVASELLGGEVMERALLTGGIRGRIEQNLDILCDKAAAETRAARELLPGGIGGTVDVRLDDIIDSISAVLSERLLTSSFEQSIAQRVILDLRDRLTQSPISPLRLFWDDKFNQMLTDRLARSLREMAGARAKEMIRDMLGRTVGDMLDTPVCELYKQYESKIPEARAALMSAYEKLVREQLGSLLGAINIGGIVEGRINSLDAAELEAMLLRLMKRELRAIVWLGALLGGIMGILNALLPL
ncbi:MAG: DUF445 family protein [Oscillospiraceae bacterium]|jgi:uncharacterized membrane protein YheB (UPF0754 family)|nr:DUF445 family protein [Oscillospiraceae bacterium]